MDKDQQEKLAQKKSNETFNSITEKVKTENQNQTHNSRREGMGTEYEEKTDVRDRTCRCKMPISMDKVKLVHGIGILYFQGLNTLCNCAESRDLPHE